LGQQLFDQLDKLEQQRRDVAGIGGATRRALCPFIFRVWYRQESGDRLTSQVLVSSKEPAFLKNYTFDPAWQQKLKGKIFI
jgi:hypothetical protein